VTPAPTLQEVIDQVHADSHDDQPLSRLQAATALVREYDEVGDAALGYFVDRARRAGHSWSEIGEALGVSKQAAQQKHSLRMGFGAHPPTLERLTPRARNVLAAAVLVARELRHPAVTTEHVLLGLYREPEGIAAKVLTGAGLSERKAKAAVARLVPPGPGAPEGDPSWAPSTRAVFSEALAAALEMGHNYIGTEHFLVGLARADGAAAEVLRGARLDDERLTAQLLEAVGAVATTGQPKGRAPRGGTKAARGARAGGGGAATPRTPR
jgi:hypothetical protein